MHKKTFKHAWIVPGLFAFISILLLQGCAPPRAADAGKHSGSAWWEEEVEVPSTPYKASSYYFCFWNLENFFDDQNDHRTGPDEEYDLWFSEDKGDFEKKLKHL